MSSYKKFKIVEKCSKLCYAQILNRLDAFVCHHQLRMVFRFFISAWNCWSLCDIWVPSQKDFLRNPFFYPWLHFPKSQDCSKEKMSRQVDVRDSWSFVSIENYMIKIYYAFGKVKNWSWIVIENLSYPKGQFFWIFSHCSFFMGPLLSSYLWNEVIYMHFYFKLTFRDFYGFNQDMNDSILCF